MVGQCYIPNSPAKIIVHDGYAYIASKYNGLVVVNIKNSNAPEDNYAEQELIRNSEQYDRKALTYVAYSDFNYAAYEVDMKLLDLAEENDIVDLWNAQLLDALLKRGVFW